MELADKQGSQNYVEEFDDLVEQQENLANNQSSAYLVQSLKNDQNQQLEYDVDVAEYQVYDGHQVFDNHNDKEQEKLSELLSLKLKSHSISQSTTNQNNKQCDNSNVQISNIRSNFMSSQFSKNYVHNKFNLPALNIHNHNQKKIPENFGRVSIGSIDSINSIENIRNIGNVNVKGNIDINNYSKIKSSNSNYNNHQNPNQKLNNDYSQKHNLNHHNKDIMNSMNFRKFQKRVHIDNKFNSTKDQKSKSINHEQRQKLFTNGLKLPTFSQVKIPPQVPKRQVRKTTQTFKQRQMYLKQYFSPNQILDKYKILSHIGKGSFSIVSLALQAQTKKRFAIKTYIKIDQIQFFKFQNIQREIINLLALKHKNIVNLDHAILQHRKILLIMEDAGKQSLAGILRKLKVFDQSLIKIYLKEILQALKYCHEKKICHRDLKLQNILVNDRNNIKIIDFGFSIDSSTKLNTFCGTPPYMAPQVTLKVPYYGNSADMWSLGVIVYMMVYGKFPFKANNQKQLYRIIQQGKINHLDDKPTYIKEIINKMLRVDVSQRATAQQILRYIQAVQVGHGVM